MLTEAQLMALANPVWNRLRELEQRLVQTMCDRIRRIGTLTSSDVHRLYELQQLGADIAAMQDEIASALGTASDDIYRIMREAAEREYAGTRVAYELAGRPYIPFWENQRLQDLITSISRAAVNDMTNWSHTLGFVNVPRVLGTVGTKHQPLAQYYQSIVDFASLQVRTGVDSFDTAMRTVIRHMSDNGLSFVDYESGHRRRLDTAVRANMMDAQARLSLEQAYLTGAEFGADGMEVSWHSGARESHVWIGGAQVDRATFERYIEPVMMEPNCYHRAFPILLGVSRPAYTADELAALNARDAQQRLFGGKTYNAYEAQQEQRWYETEIRKHKDRTNAFRASGDAETAREARARARVLQNEYARFSEAMKIPIKPARTRVSGFR